MNAMLRGVTFVDAATTRRGKERESTSGKEREKSL